MDCPSCGAPLHLTAADDSLRCEYCRGVYVPEQNDEGVRVLGEASPLACPVCAVPLVQAALGGERIVYCKQCRGILVSMNAFVALVEALRAQNGDSVRIQPTPDRKQLERHIACPQCHQRMDTHFYEGPGNIIIDACSRCYLNWLDAGELMRVVRAPDHHYAEDVYGH